MSDGSVDPKEKGYVSVGSWTGRRTTWSEESSTEPGTQQTSTQLYGLNDEKNRRFLRLGTLDPWGRIFPRSAHCRMNSCTLGLYPLDTSSTAHIVRTHNVRMSLGGGDIITPSPALSPPCGERI